MPTVNFLSLTRVWDPGLTSWTDDLVVKSWILCYVFLILMKEHADLKILCHTGHGSLALVDFLLSLKKYLLFMCLQFYLSGLESQWVMVHTQVTLFVPVGRLVL